MPQEAHICSPKVVIRPFLSAGRARVHLRYRLQWLHWMSYARW